MNILGVIEGIKGGSAFSKHIKQFIEQFYTVL